MTQENQYDPGECAPNPNTDTIDARRMQNKNVLPCWRGCKAVQPFWKTAVCFPGKEQGTAVNFVFPT